MKVKWPIGLMTLYFAGWLAGTARADFLLDGTQHLDVTGFHTTGILFDSSTINFSGGPVSVATLFACDTSTVTFLSGYYYSGPTVGTLYARDGSTVDISGGSFSTLRAYATSTVDISGGSINGFFYAYDTIAVDISGGSVYYLTAYESSNVDISGGKVSSLTARDTSTMNMSGGAVGGNLFARGNSTVSISGGSVGNLITYDTSTVDISGGSIKLLAPYEASTVDISGGSFSTLHASNTSTVTFDGQHFMLGSGLSLNGDRVLGTGILSGKWFDDTPWTVTIDQNDATIRLQGDLLGDFDGDLDVDNADIGLAAGNFTGSTGSGMSYADGDIDGDGDVDNADIGFIMGAFTGAMSSGSQSPPVPEPATLSLLTLGGLALIRRRRK